MKCYFGIVAQRNQYWQVVSGLRVTVKHFACPPSKPPSSLKVCSHRKRQLILNVAQLHSWSLESGWKYMQICSVWHKLRCNVSLLVETVSSWEFVIILRLCHKRKRGATEENNNRASGAGSSRLSHRPCPHLALTSVLGDLVTNGQLCTGVNTPRMHWGNIGDLTTQTRCGGDVGHMRPQSFSFRYSELQWRISHSADILCHSITGLATISWWTENTQSTYLMCVVLASFTQCQAALVVNLHVLPYIIFTIRLSWRCCQGKFTCWMVQ